MPTYDLYLPRRPYLSQQMVRSVPFRPLAALSALIARWIERTRQRKALADLDDCMLRDIGVTRVERESEKPFWR